MRSKLEQCKAGYAVLLTNDSAYWKVPTRTSTVDADFRLHEGRAVSGVLAWASSSKPGTVRGREAPIEIHGSYRLCWKLFSKVPATPYGSFRNLPVSVE